MADVVEIALADLLTAWLAGAQSLEAAFQQLLTQRNIETAVGAQLDVIGKLVGQPRDGLDDDTYRRYIRARITTNRSSGTVGDALKIARLLLGEPVPQLILNNWGTAAYELVVEGASIPTALAQVIIDFLVDGTAAGVRPILKSSSSPLKRLRINRAGLGIGDGVLVSSRDH